MTSPYFNNELVEKLGVLVTLILDPFQHSFTWLFDEVPTVRRAGHIIEWTAIATLHTCPKTITRSALTPTTLGQG